MIGWLARQETIIPNRANADEQTMLGPPSYRTPISAEFLGRIGLFGALDNNALEQLAASLKTTMKEPGVFVFREGDASDGMYVVLHGELEVVKRSSVGVDARVSLLGDGDWFGEMSLIDMQPRSASVRSLASSRLLAISPSDLEALYRHDAKSYHLLVLNIARELCRRLRVADGVLADMIVPPEAWIR